MTDAELGYEDPRGFAVEALAQPDLSARARFTPLLCDGYRLTGVRRLAHLISFLREAAPRRPGHRLLTTLDDFGQALYTAAHAIGAHDLDSVEGRDLSGLPRRLFDETGEHQGCLTDRAEFPIRLANLEERAAEIDWEAVCAKGVLDFPAAARRNDGALDYGSPDFFTLNDSPDIVVDPREIYVQAVPVADAFQTVAAFPNGYFYDHLTPMELYRMAERLERAHGYALIGIGASVAAFLRDAPCDAAAAAACAADLSALAGTRRTPDQEAPIAALLTRSPTLLAHYTC